MRKVQIITDSCSDLTPDLMEQYGIDYAMMNTVYQGVETPADLAWTEEEVHKLYNIMRGGDRVTTTQVPVSEFNRVFRKHLDQGSDIVYIGCSLKQSGSVNTASVLAEELKKEYTEAEIYCIDSMRACTGEGILAIEAAKMAANGLTASEVTEGVKKMRNNVLQFCTVHSLDALHRAGRVKASAAFFGNLMGVKPILVADADGEQAAFKKVRGRANSLEEIVNLLKGQITDSGDQTIYITHSDADMEEVKEVEEMVRREIPCKNIYISYIGPIIGASLGPDAIAVFGIGKEVAFHASTR